MVKENPELPRSARLEQRGRQGGQTGGGQHPWQAGRGASGTQHREITDTAQGDHGHGTGGSKTRHREITATALEFVDMMPGAHKSRLIIP